MKCAQCNSKASVVETRQKPDGDMRRRYKCDCGFKFSTTEMTNERYEKLKLALEQLETLKVIMG